jgi:RimJ/RimL family protein N-acetyltransferase
MKHIPGGKRENGAAEKSLSKFMQFYEQSGFGMYVLEETGVPIGYCGLRNFEWDSNFFGTELGYIIDKRHWGKGYAKEAAESVLKFARNTLGLNKILALVGDENFASIKIVAGLGFVRERRKPANLPTNSVWQFSN